MGFDILMSHCWNCGVIVAKDSKCATTIFRYRNETHQRKRARGLYSCCRGLGVHFGGN